MTAVLPSLAHRIDEVLALDPAAPAIEFDGRWTTWGELGRAADRVGAGVTGPGTRVGVLLRNTPAHVAAVIGVLAADGCLVTLNPGLGGERTGAEIQSLDLAAVAGTGADLTANSRREANDRRELVLDGDAGWSGEPAAGSPGGGSVLMLTSGTTGPPKRVELGSDLLMRTLAGAKHYESGPRPPSRLRTGVAVVNSPLVHLGGLFRVLQCVLDGRPFVLLPRFEVEAWADAVRRHRPRTASLVPTALRMVLESGLTRDDLSSLRSVVSGTAPLDPADADAFETRFGVPVLTSYAATEFGGGVAGWTLADHRQFRAAKRGSVGRAHPGCGLRVVDHDGGVLPVGETGLLEVRPAQFGPDADRVRTTDLARLDADGFLWIEGRADQTILRGGFKVQPDVVRAALEALPQVRAAAVLGVPDTRLGAVPVALVELREDAGERDLLARLDARLARYELPTRIRTVEALPRTPSGKVDLAAARELL